MKIIINENKLLLIKEGSKEEKVTFYKFFTEVKNFLKDLLEDPIGAKPGSFFKDNNISKSELLNKMLDRGIIKKKENIDEPNDADGKMKSMHYLQYSIPRKNFERSIKRLYSFFFENEKRKINEDVEKKSHYDSAATYIFCKDKKGTLCVLGGKRRGNNNGGRYNVPTGQVGDKFQFESVLDAAAREVREESGLNIPTSLFQDIGDEQYTNNWGECIGKNYMVMLNGTTDEHQPGRGDGENDRFEWIPIEAVDCLNWAFGMGNKIHRIIKYYEKTNTFN